MLFYKCINADDLELFEFRTFQIEKEEEESGKLSVWEGSGGLSVVDLDNSSRQTGGIFGDNEQRLFYEELVDLIDVMPLAVLGFTPEKVQFML